MRTSDQLDELAAALSAAQSEVKEAQKSATNPHFRRTYATLADVWDVIRGPFTSNGLSVTQLTSINQYGMVLNTVLLHKSGQFVQGEYPIVPTKNDPQGYGSAITYARRYALMSIGGVCPDDDDGNAASAPPATSPLGTGMLLKKQELPQTVKMKPAEPKVTGAWVLAYKSPEGFAKLMKSQILKAPDYKSYEKLFTDNNDNIMRLMRENTKLHDEVIAVANSRKEELVNKENQSD